MQHYAFVLTDRPLRAAEGGSPTAIPTWRGLSPLARLSRRTSRILRMAERGRGTGISPGAVWATSRTVHTAPGNS